MTTPYKTGARPSPRHVLLAARPHTVIKNPPPQAGYFPAQLSFWDNDHDGICVTAEEAFAKACYKPEILISDAEVIAWAKAHGVLNGADLTSVLDWMAQKGFEQDGSTYDDGGRSGVDYSNEVVLQSAISTGPVKIAIDHAALPGNAGPPSGWHAFGGSPGQFTNTDHCVCVCAYGPTAWIAQQIQSVYGVIVNLPANAPANGYGVFTWNSIGIADHAWLMSTCVEAWVRSPTTIIIGPGPAPTPPGPGPGPTPPPVGPTPLYTLHFNRSLAKGQEAKFIVPVSTPKGSALSVFPPGQSDYPIGPTEITCE